MTAAASTSAEPGISMPPDAGEPEDPRQLGDRGDRAEPRSCLDTWLPGSVFLAYPLHVLVK
jgi:hypothetical protein